jgi:hypothetical protein
MSDVSYIALIFLLFASAIGYLYFCGSLNKEGRDK